ncbi:MAG: glycosyltransferase [Actinomycetota bacterium]|nr:glycosyltransferase [Actinomycetota bacterium]
MRRTLPRRRTAVRSVDLFLSPQSIEDVSDYEYVRVFARHGSRVVGFADIAHHRGSVSARQVGEALVDALGIRLLPGVSGAAADRAWMQVLLALARQLLPDDEADIVETSPLEADVSASVVVATLDRPGELRECLQCLTAQESTRQVQIVVVDNNPASRLTPAVVEQFPDVVLVEEPRKGLSYARNAGILAATGEIVAMTDDDVRTPPNWLENLLAPFARGDVAAVTGNVLPLELDTLAQRLFESYGGLGRGFDRVEYDGAWFESKRSAPPTWLIGATANAAFRSSVFRDRDIGLLHETLGPGTPAGVGEDTYLFYKILKSGHTIVYEPSAYVWHRHRAEMRALRQQLFGYSKGHVAYHLTTLIEDHDLRALVYLGARLPAGHLRRLVQGLRGDTTYLLRLNLLEIVGNLAGPLAFWQSRRRARRLGPSNSSTSAAAQASTSAR